MAFWWPNPALVSEIPLNKQNTGRPPAVIVHDARLSGCVTWRQSVSMVVRHTFTIRKRAKFLRVCNKYSAGPIRDSYSQSTLLSGSMENTYNSINVPSPSSLKLPTIPILLPPTCNSNCHSIFLKSNYNKPLFIQI